MNVSIGNIQNRMISKRFEWEMEGYVSEYYKRQFP